MSAPTTPAPTTPAPTTPAPTTQVPSHDQYSSEMSGDLVDAVRKAERHLEDFDYYLSEHFFEIALCANDCSAVEYLLWAGVSPRSPGDPTSSIQTALSNQNLDMVKLLFNYHASLLGDSMPIVRLHKTISLPDSALHLLWWYEAEIGNGIIHPAPNQQEIIDYLRSLSRNKTKPTTHVTSNFR